MPRCQRRLSALPSHWRAYWGRTAIRTHGRHLTGRVLRFASGWFGSFAHNVSQPLNPEERTRYGTAPRPLSISPSLPLGFYTQELPHHRIHLGEICRDLLIAAALTGWRERAVSPPRHTPRGKAKCGLPGHVFGRDLQDLRRLCPASRRRDRLSSPRRLATRRSRDDRPRRPSWRKLGFPGSSHYGRSHRRRSSLANNPRQQQLAGVLTSSRWSGRSPNPSICQSNWKRNDVSSDRIQPADGVGK